MENNNNSNTPPPNNGENSNNNGYQINNNQDNLNNMQNPQNQQHYAPYKPRRNNSLVTTLIILILILLAVIIAFVSFTFISRTGRTFTTSYSESIGSYGNSSDEYIVESAEYGENYNESALSHTITASEVKKININTTCSNVSFFIDESLDTIDVTWYTGFDDSQQKRAITQNGDTIEIKEKIKSLITPYDYTSDINIHMPSKYLSEIDINNVSGDINFSNKFSIEELDIKNISGDIQISEAEITDTFELLNTSGNLFVGFINTDELKLETISGDIVIDGLDAEKISYDSVSGDIVISGANFPQGNFQSVSGNVYVYTSGSATYALKSTSVSGDVSTDSNKINNSSNNKIEITTISGDVEIY